MASLLTGCSVFGIRSGYEQPSYVLVGTLSDQIEVRRYAPRLAVETSVDIPDYDEARSAAFRPLFDYISGANRTNESLAMTAPAEAALTSEKVTMTAPVETSRAGTGSMRMRFFLPAEFTLETAPEPIDPRVHLIEVTGQLQAVLRFSGFASEDAIAKDESSLTCARPICMERVKRTGDLLVRSTLDNTVLPAQRDCDPGFSCVVLRTMGSVTST
jgi:hypothetical protein